MLVLEPELVQVVFHLQVRKADLALVSMKELAILMTDMDIAQKTIIDRGYLVTVLQTFSGVTTSINT